MYQESKHKEAVKRALEECRTMPIPATQQNAAVCHESTASDLLAQSLSVLLGVKAIMTDIGLRLGGFSQGMEKACVDRVEPVNLFGALHELHSEARRLEELAGSIQRVL